MKGPFFASIAIFSQYVSSVAPAIDNGLAGSNTMQRIMNMKTNDHEIMRDQGIFDRGRYKVVTMYTACNGGKAGDYSCDGVDMAGFLPHEVMGSSERRGNDVWGWISPDGREFGAVGQTDGTAFVEVVSEGALKYLGRLGTQTRTSIWRDIKVIDGFAYIGSEAIGHGLQVFDMRKLLNITSPKVFNTTTDLTAWYAGFGSSHNIVAHEEANMIYAVGTERTLSCRGGLWMVDVSNPKKPSSPGCASQGGYVHDAQCVTYTGPDLQYHGREICFGFNENAMVIYDVTVKLSPQIISRTGYNGSKYTHQGWLLDQENMTHLLLDDELDERDRSGVAADEKTTTYIWDVSRLREPVLTGTYKSPVKAADHNQYVVDGLAYQANYGSGLRIVDVGTFRKDSSGKGFRQAGFFDCHPEDDEKGGDTQFRGSWSVYPYFKSGYILLNSIERGVFSLKKTV